MKTKRKIRTARIAMAAGAGVLGATAFALFGMPSHGPSEPPQKDMTVDKAIRSEVIDGVIANLDRAYVFPDKAAVMGRNLRAELQHGDFDAVTSACSIPRRSNCQP